MTNGEINGEEKNGAKRVSICIESMGTTIFILIGQRS
jgi:hypothetical protein